MPCHPIRTVASEIEDFVMSLALSSSRGAANPPVQIPPLALNHSFIQVDETQT